MAHGLSCSMACGTFPDKGSNPCPLNWQADSSLCHQGSPYSHLFLTDHYKNRKYAVNFFFFLAGHIACGILVPQSGINQCPLQGKRQVLTTGPPGKFQYILFFIETFFPLEFLCAYFFILYNIYIINFKILLYFLSYTRFSAVCLLKKC